MCIAISASNLVSLADSLIPKLVFIRRGEYSLCNPRHPDTSWSRFERENEIPWRPCSPRRLCSCSSNHLDDAFATLDCRHSTHHHGPQMIFLSRIALDLEDAQQSATLIIVILLALGLRGSIQGLFDEDPYRLCSHTHIQGLFDEDPYRLCSHTHMVLSIRSAASFGIKIGISWYTRATIINYSCSIEYDYRV